MVGRPARRPLDQGWCTGFERGSGCRQEVVTRIATGYREEMRMRLANLYIAGTGRWLPPAMSTEDAVRHGHADAATAAKTDVASVTVADTDDAPPEMAVRAATVALDRAGLGAADIGLVLHANV